jgi:hypothetical protein
MQFKAVPPAPIPLKNDPARSNPQHAKQEQDKQSFLTALAEIDELKQSLRYLEVQLAKSKE